MAMRDARLIGQVIDVVSLDSTAVRVHPDGMGALKKMVLKRQAKAAAGGQPR